MDKIEYRELIKSIKNRYLKKDYEGVIDLSDQLELERIREVSILEIVAKSYEALGRCDLAREALLIAYKRMPSGKRIAYNLAMLCIKLDDLDSAVMFYEDFCKIAPRDNQRLILKYEIGKAGGVPIKDLVRVLEVYNSREMDDKWEYELARLYHEMGDGEKCAATCDQVILWYANGEYEKKALQLKNMHKALTPEQQTRYEEIMAGILNDGATIVPIASKEEKAEAVEEMPAAESEADAAEAFASEQNAAEEVSNTAETEVPEAIETDVHENNKAEANVPTLEVPSEENWNKKRESAAEPTAQNPADQEIEYDTRHLGSEGEIPEDIDNENIEGQMSVLSMIEAYKQKTVEDVDNKVGRDRAAQIMAEVASTHDSSALEEFEGDEAEFMQEGQVEVIEPEVPLFNREDVIEPADDGGEDLGERKAEFEFEKKSKTKQPVIEDEEVVDEEDEDSEYDDYDDEDDDYEEDIADEEEDINDSAEDEPDEDEIDEDDYDDSDDEYEDDYDDEDDESEYDEEEYEEEEEEYRPVKTRSSRRKEKRRSMADDILADMVVDGGFTIEEEVEDDYDEEEDSEEELDEYDDDEAEGSENEHDDIETEDSEDDYDEDIEESEADIEEVEDEEPEAECNETDVEVEEADESEAAHDEAEIEEAEAETDDECEEEAVLAEAAAEADVGNDDIVIEDIEVEVECEEAEVEEPAAELEDADDECEDECGEADAEEFIDEYDEADAEDLEDEYPESEEDEDIADQVAAAFEAFDEGKAPKKNHKKVNPEKVIAGAAATAEQAAAGIGAAFGSLFKKNKKAQSEPERCEEDFIEEIDTPEGVFEVEREPEEVVVPRRGNKSQAKGKFAPEAPVSKEQVKAEKARIKAEKEKAKAEKAREKAEKIRKKAERLLAEKAKKEELAAARAAQEALEQEAAEQEVQPEEKKPKAKKAASSGELFQTVEPKKSTSVAKKATRAEAASAAEETVEAETVPAAEAALKKAVEEIKAEPAAQNEAVEVEPAERIAEAKVTPAAQKIAEVEAAETKAEPEIQASADEFNLDEFIKDEIGSEPAQSVKSKAAAAPQKEATAKADESANLAASIEEIVAKSAKSLSREQKHTAKPAAKSLRANVGFSSAVVTPAQGVARNAATVAAAQNMANPAAARLFAENPEPEVPSKDTASKLPKLVIPAFIKNRSSQKQSASLDSKSLDEILNSTIKDNDKKEEGFTVDVDELLDETIKADECKKSQMSEDLDGFNLDDFINPDGGEVQKNAAKKQAVFDEIFGSIEKDLKVKDEESKPKKATAAATQPLPKIQIQSPARKFGTGEYKLSREQKKELAEFLLIDGMEEEICSTIAKLVTKKKSGDETGGHLIVTGDAKTGKTFLTVEILKAVNQEVGRGNSRVAKVQAQAINGKNIMDILSKVKDSDLIIENIGRLEDDTVIELIQAVRASNAPTMIILEGNELAADTMIQNFPDIGKIFKTRINIGELTLTQWADLAQKYAASQGYSIDGMAQLALHAKIDQINTPDMRLGFKQVRQIIDDAIDKAEKRSSAKLFSAFGKKNDDELTPLMEDNFM